MKTKRSKSDERKILDLVKKGLARQPRSSDKLHVSDLLYPRKTYWGKLDPQPLTDDQALYFTAGRAHHELIEFVVQPKKKKKGTKDAGQHEREGIYFSPDLKMSFGPIEIKTNRSFFEPAPDKLEERYDSYLKQLTAYMALMDCEKGGLLVFHLVLKTKGRYKPAIRFYRVEMSKEELKKRLAELKADAKVLSEALKKKKWQQLPLCPEWLCRDCVWFQQCKPWVVDKKRKNVQKEAA